MMVLTKSVRQIAWLAWALTACFSLPAAALSTVPMPTLFAEASDGMQIVLNIPSGNVGTYAFHGAVSWPMHTPAYSTGADVYFGLFLPGGKSVYTWAPQNGVATLTPGYVPFTRAIPNNTLFQAFANNATQYPVSYRLNGTEPKGLYFVFLLLVYPGGDPNDSRQWSQISTQPFVLN